MSLVYDSMNHSGGVQDKCIYSPSLDVTLTLCRDSKDIGDLLISISRAIEQPQYCPPFSSDSCQSKCSLCVSHA